jgi:hypothetical protein
MASLEKEEEALPNINRKLRQNSLPISYQNSHIYLEKISNQDIKYFIKNVWGPINDNINML